MSELNEADEVRLVDDMSDAMRMHDGTTSTWMSHARKVLHDLTAKGYVIIPPPESEPVYLIRLTEEQKYILAQTVSQRMAVDEFESRVLDELSDLLANAQPEERS